MAVEPHRETPGARARTAVRRWKVLRALHRGVRRVLHDDDVLVTVMAAVVALSALSVDQATRASDEAGRLMDEARILQAQDARRSSYLRTLVDHDLNVLGPYCASTIERDTGRVRLLDADPELAGVVAADLDLRALKPLLQADQPAEPCGDATAPGGAAGGYDVARARQTVQPPDLQGGSGWVAGGAPAVIAQAHDLSDRERNLMSAGVLFAVALFGFIAVDVLGNRSQRPARLARGRPVRWQRRSLGLSAVAVLAGAVLLFDSAVDHLYLLGPLCVLAAVLAGRARTLTKRARAAEAGGSLDSPVGAPHWWAEVVGAVTLVAFSCCALGLSYVSAMERDERARSESQHAAARQLEEEGAQAGLRDLAVVAELAGQEADVAAANQASSAEPGDGSADGAALRARLAEFTDRRQAVERSVRDQLQHETPRSASCPESLSKPQHTPEDLRANGSDEQAFAQHLLAYQRSAATCDVLSSVTREVASRWALHASTFTVALVVLGLAGFLLALAADPDRSRRSAGWLVLVGGAGTAAGLVMSAFVVVSLAGTGTSWDERQRLSFARAVAAVDHMPCEDALEVIDRAIEDYPGHGPAYIARGNVRICLGQPTSQTAVLTSAIEPAAVPDIVRDLDRAVRSGTATPSTQANLGWFLILRGIQEGEDGASDVRRGMALTRAALRAVEASDSTVPYVHSMRFNRALALVALGQDASALASYRHAVGCLDAGAGCGGGGVLDADRRAEYVLWALADLELLEPGRDLDAFRAAVVSELNQTPLSAADWEGGRLDVFGQEVQVADGGSGVYPHAVVWYHRPDEEAPWGVLERPSATTVRTGQHAGRPLPAGQLMNAGQYRADVYAGGRKAASLLQSRTGGTDAVRRSSQQLGVSVVVPDGWTEAVPLEGVEWNLSPSEGAGFFVTRLEGVTPDKDVATFLQEQLDQWVPAGLVDDRDPSEETTDGYFLGLHDRVVRHYTGQPLTAGAAFAPYASGPGCGGAVIMAAIGGDGVTQEMVDEIFESMVLDEPQQKVPRLTGTFEGERFAVAIPETWDGAGRPPGGTGNALSAKHCETGANVLVTDESLDDRTVDEVVDSSVAEYRTDFPEFHLLSREPVQVQGAEEAVELQFTWRSGNGPVRQRQLFAADRQTLVYLTFTTWPDPPADDAAAGDLLLGSLRLVAPTAAS